MSKFVIECSGCGSYVEVATGFFAKKTVKCTCGRKIDVNKEKMASKLCPHCGNTVMFDQSKGEAATCPICHEKINTAESKFTLIKLTCPSCQNELNVDKNAEKHTCALCGNTFDVKKRIAQIESKNSGNASLIKWEANNDTFVWKHPIEDFNFGSQLIVHQSQEALFFRDGRALDLFGAGRYTLEKHHVPLLNDAYKLSDDSDVAIHTEVYFVNKTVQTGIRWGTPSRVRIIEPHSNIPIEIGARGSFNLEVVNSATLILRLVGTASGFAQNEVVNGGAAYSSEYMRGKFADMIAMNVTSLLARVITENKLNVLTIDTMKPEISRILGNAINRELAAYGLQIPEGQFYVTDVMTPDDDPNYIRLKNQYVTASLDIRDEEIAKAKIEASEARIMAQKSLDAKTGIFDAQTDAAIAKINAESAASTVRTVANASADTTIISARAAAEGIKLEGHAEADAYRAQAMAEADEMKAKGYTYQDETRRMVNLEAMQNGLPGTGADSGVGSVIGAGVTMGAINGIVNMTKEMIDPIIHDATGLGLSNSANTWDCACGKKGISSKFCPECGAARPAPVSTWNCTCGQSDISSNFCPNCGTKRPEATWTCSGCGLSGISSNFCPNCGKRK